MLEQIISIAGALMILIAYGSNQANKLSQNSYTYLLLNLFGAFILAVVAYRAKQIGLTLVESAWTAISLVSLVKLMGFSKK